jgi:hypothetical protein
MQHSLEWQAWVRMDEGLSGSVALSGTQATSTACATGSGTGSASGTELCQARCRDGTGPGFTLT